MGLIGDTYFYIAMTLAVAASRVIRGLTLATEIEMDQSEDYHGGIAFFDSNMP